MPRAGSPTMAMTVGARTMCGHDAATQRKPNRSVRCKTVMKMHETPCKKYFKLLKTLQLVVKIIKMMKK